MSTASTPHFNNAASAVCDNERSLLDFPAGEDAAIRPILAMLASEEKKRQTQPGYKSDSAHDTSHSLRVARLALELSRDAATPIDPRAVIAAALLHDVIAVPKNSPDRARASELCAAESRRYLEAAGWDKFPELSAWIKPVGDAIRTHSYSRGEKPVNELGCILQDADRLEALGAIGIFRCIATGAQMGAAFFDGADPWAEGRPLDDRAYSVDHFFTKLLKLPELMQTPQGRMRAEARADIMRGFLRVLGEEIGCPFPENSKAEKRESRA